MLKSKITNVVKIFLHRGQSYLKILERLLLKISGEKELSYRFERSHGKKICHHCRKTWRET